MCGYLYIIYEYFYHISPSSSHSLIRGFNFIMTKSFSGSNMKRSNQQLSSQDTGQQWSGISTGSDRTTASFVEVVSKTQKLMDQGIRVHHVCELCHIQISGQKSCYCPHCDAGPFHETCSLGHLCPQVSRGMEETETLQQR